MNNLILNNGLVLVSKPSNTVRIHYTDPETGARHQLTKKLWSQHCGRPGYYDALMEMLSQKLDFEQKMAYLGSVGPLMALVGPDLGR